MKMLIIADDLSGAMDCAIGFASAGRQAIVALHPLATWSMGADVVAIDADTRRLAPQDAARACVDIYAQMRGREQRLYKKMDSTLRGNWAAEVKALTVVAGTAIVAPAYPATGRVVRDGRVYVDGEDLERTAIWKLENDGKCADIAFQLNAAGLSTALLSADALRGDVRALSLGLDAAMASGIGAVIVDAASQDALRTLAGATLSMDRPAFWVGSGGLAREIAGWGASPSGTGQRHSLPALGPTLALVGSLSAISKRQCEILREEANIQQLIIPPAVLRSGERNPDWKSLRQVVGSALSGGLDLVLSIGRDSGFVPSEGPLLSNALARLVGPSLPCCGGLIATGGETARAVLAAARIRHLYVCEEIEPGVAVASAFDGAVMRLPWIVTKAGAFGTDRALYRAWTWLRDHRQPAANPWPYPKESLQPKPL